MMSLVRRYLVHDRQFCSLKDSNRGLPCVCAGLGPNAQRKGNSWFDWWFLRRSKPKKTMATTIPMKIEPKTFFANERTFLSWLHMAITIGSIGAALLGFSGAATHDAKAHQARTVA